MADLPEIWRYRRCGVIVAVLTLAAAHATAAGVPLPVGPVDPAEIKIVSTEFEYSPAKVWVVAGRQVTLVLDNRGPKRSTELLFRPLVFA